MPDSETIMTHRASLKPRHILSFAFIIELLQIRRTVHRLSDNNKHLLDREHHALPRLEDPDVLLEAHELGTV